MMMMMMSRHENDDDGDSDQVDDDDDGGGCSYRNEGVLKVVVAMSADKGFRSMLLCNVVECVMYGSGWVGTSKLAAWKSKEGPSCRQRLGKHLRGKMSPSYHFFLFLFSLAPLPTFLDFFFFFFFDLSSFCCCFCC